VVTAKPVLMTALSSNDVPMHIDQVARHEITDACGRIAADSSFERPLPNYRSHRSP
jgi:hypothetical protein